VSALGWGISIGSAVVLGWIYYFWSKGSMNKTASNAHEIQRAITWTTDAPLFIDQKTINAFYDAVVRPPFETGARVLSISEGTAKSLNSTIGLEGEIEVGGWLAWLGNASIKPKVEAGRERTEQAGRGMTVELHEISNPWRQLQQLAFYYWTELRDRFLVVTDIASEAWRDASWISKTPRALVFLEVPPKTLFIPTAAEFENGKIVLIYRDLYRNDGQRPPDYPEKASTPEELAQKRKEYWRWFHESVGATQAMLAVEQAASANGRIRWIDYRMMLGKEGQSVHLHVCPSETYDTGTFAYNFVKRGFTHGLRIAGTLKSEPSLNVLAIYER
jgi:hypothetical protein